MAVQARQEGWREVRFFAPCTIGCLATVGLAVSMLLLLLRGDRSRQAKGRQGQK